jgi:hypothetical protein
VTPTGLQDVAISKGKRKELKVGEAESEAVPPDLASVIVAWPKLPAPIRAAIRALIQTSN